ncbi:Sip1-related alpha-galactosidase [Pelagicoccus albus]|uniref:Raffinose synthase or seed imbibition protein Sip1 n=1 Tax=Pelagicoccus albus TaxID=415222 RepID=A0A7X1B7N1_9BACT|nr:Sip1-related alpha-galactosidase [Pelagicoccus albus]MBC2607067.1 hypothetical protein [Pelagicoccus albus]
MPLNSKPESLILGLGTNSEWQPIASSNGEAWILKPRRIGQRDTDFGSLSFPDSKKHFIATRPGVFWMTPKWVKDPSSLENSKRGEDLGYVLVQREDNSCVLLLPIPTSTQRGRLFLRNGICAGLRSDPNTPPESPQPAFLIAHGTDPISLLASVIRITREILPSFKLREEKTVPNFVDTLGWCTWDAFYKEVDQEGVLNGVRKLKKGQHCPAFVIIDDGWQKVSQSDKLINTEADIDSFPDSLEGVIKQLKSEYGISFVGVWHALQGYWSGVAPEGEIGLRYATETVEGAPEAFEGWHKQFSSESRTHITAQDINRFYHAFYRELSESGVDLVKVDNQAQLEIFTDREDLAENKTCAAYQSAIQTAATQEMGGNLLHCMGQSTEIYCRLSEGNLARNSDDFYPQKPDTAQVDHIVQNAFNAPFTSQFCLPDWDMFQTYHPRAEFHAIARVISGGPLYISDKPDQTKHAMLDRLVLGQNRILRFSQPALPLARQFFNDPRRSKEPLVLINSHQAGFGAVAFFNCHPHETLDGKFKIEELTGFNAPQYAVLNHQDQSICYYSPREYIHCQLAPTNATLFSIAPVFYGQACLGISGKLNGIAALLAVEEFGRGSVRYTLSASAPVSFASTKKIRKVLLNGLELGRDKIHETVSGYTICIPEFPNHSCTLDVQTEISGT